jgi:hypothetical protein
VEPDIPNAEAGQDAGGPERPQTGDQRVDEALRGLDELDELPVSEHPPVFERIHGELVEVLGELRDRPAGGSHDNAARGGHDNGARGGHDNAARGGHDNGARGSHDNAARGRDRPAG